MDILIRFGFSVEEIKNIMDANIDIGSINDAGLEKLIKLLEDLGCSHSEIKNILIANPFYLNRELKDVKKLIKELEKLNIKYLNTVIDSNPFLLNYDDNELIEKINQKSNEGLNKYEIIDYIKYELM